MSCKSLTVLNISVQLQLVITSKLQTVWIPIRYGQNLMPDLGPNCLKGLSADDNVMSRFNAK